MKYQLEIKPKENGYTFSMSWGKGKQISGCDESLVTVMDSVEGQIRASLGLEDLIAGPANEAFRSKARDEYQKEGEIEIDDNAAVSAADPKLGAYVQAWVWIEADQSEEETEE